LLAGKNQVAQNCFTSNTNKRSGEEKHFKGRKTAILFLHFSGWKNGDYKSPLTSSTVMAA